MQYVQKVRQESPNPAKQPKLLSLLRNNIQNKGQYKLYKTTNFRQAERRRFVPLEHRKRKPRSGVCRGLPSGEYVRRGFWAENTPSNPADCNALWAQLTDGAAP